MNRQVLEQVHRLFEQEQDRLEWKLVHDPAFASLVGRIAQTEARLITGLEPQQAQALQEARRLLLQLTYEAAFKTGYLFAHAHAPEEAAGPEAPPPAGRAG